MSGPLPDYIGKDIPLSRGQRRATSENAWNSAMRDWRNAMIYVAVMALILGSTVGIVFGGYTMMSGRLWLLVAMLVLNYAFWWCTGPTTTAYRAGGWRLNTSTSRAGSEHGRRGATAGSDTTRPTSTGVESLTI